jgi:hypothetical protein
VTASATMTVFHLFIEESSQRVAEKLTTPVNLLRSNLDLQDRRYNE